MINKQVYKDSISSEKALQEIRDEAGEQFDTELAYTFIDMLEEKISDIDLSV